MIGNTPWAWAGATPARRRSSSARVIRPSIVSLLFPPGATPRGEVFPDLIDAPLRHAVEHALVAEVRERGLEPRGLVATGAAEARHFHRVVLRGPRGGDLLGPPVEDRHV